MARFKPNRLPYSTQDAMWLRFCGVVHRLKSTEDIHRFFKDLFNRQERVMVVRRLEIAKRLYEGMTYEEIVKELKTSPLTIARVQRWLEFGREGYKTAIKELLKMGKQNKN